MAKKTPETTPESVELPALESLAEDRQDNRPRCPRHGAQMVAYATKTICTYYRCPEPNCRETSKAYRNVGPFRGKYGNSQ